VGRAVTYRTILSTVAARQRAKDLIDRAPTGFVATVSEPKRTTDQNSRLWAMLSDVALAKPMGRRHTPEEWKCIFMAACGWEVLFLEGLDGRPFPQGFRSSQMTKSQMTTLQDFIEAWGAENGVKFSDQEQAA
jgi:hypothetical protein